MQPEFEVAARAGRRGLGDWLRLGFLVAVLAFGVIIVVSRWSELSAALRTMSWGLVAAAAVPAAAGTWLGVLGWRAVIVDLGGQLSVSQAGRVFLIGQLGKYLPGSIWSFLAQAELARDHEVSRKATLTGSMIAIAISLGGGAIVTVLMLPLGAADAFRRYWWVSLIIPLCVITLHPRILGPVLDRGLRMIRRQPLEQYPTYRGQLTSACWYVLGWILLGLQAWLLMLSLGAPAARSLPIAIGGFALAVVLGVIFIPAPAGAGIREVAMVVAFSSVLTSSEALAVALTSRIMLTALDFVLAGISWASRAAPAENHEARGVRVDRQRARAVEHRSRPSRAWPCTR